MILLFRTNFLCLILLILFSAPVSIEAQNKFNFEQYKNETGEYFNFPKRWTGKDYLITAGIAAGTYLLMNFDDNIRSEVLKGEDYESLLPLEFGRIWGEPYSTLSLGLFFLIYGDARSNSANEKLGFEILQSFSYTAVSTQILKITFGRTRPYAAVNSFELNPFQFEEEKWSLPSGHTSIAFSLSTVLAENTDKIGLKILYFTPAFITAISRVLYNKHWTSDVFMGAFLGYFTAKFVADIHEKNEQITPPQHTPLLNFTFPF